jgi:glycosyltransferase involved in cell wall biosynthesis
MAGCGRRDALSGDDEISWEEEASVTGRARSLYLGVRRQAGRVVRATGARRASRGRVPVVERRTTHLGSAVDELVHQAELRMRVGVNREHDLVRENFDALHYLLQNRDLMTNTQVDLVEHFLQHGVEAQSSPQPHFSMTNYLRQHPERADGRRHPYVAWLEEGRAAGEHADPLPRPDLLASLLGLEADEIVKRVVARRTDLLERLRTGRLGEVVAKAAEIEPLIGGAWPAINRPLLMPLTSLEVVAGMSALFRCHEAADFRPARVVLVVNQARRARDPGIEGYLTHALARHTDPADIVVVHTDASIARPYDRHPPGVRQIDFAKFAADLPTDEETEVDAREQVLVTLLRTFRADAIVNIRSRLLFRAMRTYTPALTASERVFLCLSGNEQTPMGTWDGWGPHYFYRTFDRVAGVITDNAHFEEFLTQTYQLPAYDRERLHLLRVPVDPDIPVAPRPPRQPGRRPQVFWVGRWSRQRKVDTLVEVAARMPDVDFRVWASGPVPAAGGSELPSNLVIERAAPRTADLPLGEADVWLHTAEWDTVPVQLLEVAMTGVPIVGTRVGGTGEVIGEDGWQVPADGDAGEYESAIRSVLAGLDEARERAQTLRERMLSDRSAEQFASSVADLLLVPVGEEVGSHG